MPPQNECSPEDAQLLQPPLLKPSLSEGPGPDFETGMPPIEMDPDTVLRILRMLHNPEQGCCERTGFSASALGATRGRSRWLNDGYED